MTNPTAADDDNDNDDSLFNRLPDGGLPSIGPCFDFISAFDSLRNFTTLKSVSLNFPSDFDSPTFDVLTACFKSDSFFSTIKSMNKFTGLNSLSIKLLFSKSQQQEEDVDVDYNRYLFKWKAKLGSCRLDSFCYLSPNSIRSSGNGHQDDKEEDEDVKMKYHIAVTCLSNANERFNMMINFIICFPSMEKVSVTDSAQRGTVSVNGEKVTDLHNWGFSCSPSYTVKGRPRRMKWCYVPLLELPVSGYVMKGVTLLIFERDDVPDNGNDSFLNVDEYDIGFEDKEVDGAYTEAVIEIFKKHRENIETL